MTHRHWILIAPKKPINRTKYDLNNFLRYHFLFLRIEFLKRYNRFLFLTTQLPVFFFLRWNESVSLDSFIHSISNQTHLLWNVSFFTKSFLNIGTSDSIKSLLIDTKSVLLFPCLYKYGFYTSFDSKKKFFIKIHLIVHCLSNRFEPIKSQ